MDTHLTKHGIDLMLALSPEMQAFIWIIPIKTVKYVQTITLHCRTTILDDTHMKNVMFPPKFNGLVDIGTLQKGSITPHKMDMCNF